MFVVLYGATFGMGECGKSASRLFVCEYLLEWTGMLGAWWWYTYNMQCIGIALRLHTHTYFIHSRAAEQPRAFPIRIWIRSAHKCFMCFGWAPVCGWWCDLCVHSHSDVYHAFRVCVHKPPYTVYAPPLYVRVQVDVVGFPSIPWTSHGIHV